MSETTLKPGDIVMLKSGGPKMTVGSVGDYVTCVWFPTLTSEVPTSRSFEKAILRRVTEEPDDSTDGGVIVGNG